MKTFRNILDSSARRLASLASLAIALYACSALTSCSDDSDIFPSPTDKEGCFITVEVPMLDRGSRAAITDEFNEFTVETLDLFFYKSNDKLEEPAIYHKRISEKFVQKKQLQVNIPNKDINTIFGDGSKCYLYAVANYSGALSDKATPLQLQALQADSNIEKTVKQTSFAMISDDMAEVTLSSDKKTASGSVTLTRACAKLMLSLNIPESIEVTNTIEDPGSGTTTETKVKYIPNPESARVWISNGVKKSIIKQDITNDTKIASENYYSNTIGDATEGNGTDFTELSGEYKWVQSIPFYSYPNKWDPKSAEGVTTITFQIPWHIEGETNQTVTYYSITVNPDNCRLLRNHFYDMRLTVGRLGSVDVREPIDMEVTWNYELPWKEHTLETNIRDVRYLLLNNNDYDESSNFPVIEDSTKTGKADYTMPTQKGWYVYRMNNETEIEIPVSTSHNVEIYRVEMIWRDFKDNVNRFTTVTSGTGSGQYDTCNGYNKGTTGVNNGEPTHGTAFLGLEFDNTTSTLKLSRDLYDIKSDWSQSTPTYTPMYINVYIRHTDNHAYTQKIRIEQYPPIYISSQQTNKIDDKYTRFVDNKTTGQNIGRDRDIWATNGTNIYLGSLQDIGSRNANTYIISVSRLGEKENNYVLADPRSMSIENKLLEGSTNWSASVQDINNTKRQLTYYYPVDPNISKKTFVAPKLRIASQWGMTDGTSGTVNNQTYTLDYDNATRRCASYQENGRPAGRWRLPTVAEIKFIAELSRLKFIPTLFGNWAFKDNGDPWVYSYFCATGVVRVTAIKDKNDEYKLEEANNLISGDVTSVRCVYDEWYWGNDTLVESQKATFVWGDRQRSTSGNEYKSIKR